MAATTRVVLNPYFHYSGTEWTDQVISVEFPFSREELEATASGDGTRVKVPGLETWSCSVTCHRNIGAAGIEGLAWTAKEAEKPPSGVASVLIFAFADSAVDPANPYYTVNAYIKDMPIAGGAVGSIDTVTVVFMAAGDIGRTTA